MRISDWSSDVCSSDLAGEDQGGGCRDRPKKKSNAAHRTFTSAATTSSNSWAPNCRNGLPFTKDVGVARVSVVRSEEHTSELQSLMRTSYAVFCLQNKIQLHRITAYGQSQFTYTHIVTRHQHH